MSRIRIAMLTASLFATTGLVPIASAQTPNSAAMAEQGQSCEAVRMLIEENPDRLRAEWVQEANGVVQGAVVADCAAYYEQARVALDQQPGDEQNVDAAARIVVTQPDPEVSVEQTSPEITVTQQQPQVSIDQGRPDVLVRQTPPNVTVQIPQPIITIEQPAPEIIITMPEPDVSVTTAEPQVEVRQAEPTVTVQQGEPQVQVQAQEGAGADTNAQIDIQQGEPTVAQQSAEGQPQIDIQRQEPVVRFEPAQPNVRVESQGEPEIRFGQTGEPNIQVRRAGEADDAAATRGAGTTEAANPDDAGTSLRGPAEPMEAGEPLVYNVSDVLGRSVMNGEGQELGTVERIVDRDGRDFVILAEGGFLGMGGTEVGLPLDSMSVVEDHLLMRGMSEEDIEAMPEFNSEGAEEYAPEHQVSIATP